MKEIVHFTGIGGIGMSALARYFLSEGWTVQGSDCANSPLIDELKKEGISINIAKHSANKINNDIALVIYTQAISQRHPELVKAKKLSLSCKSYPEAIGELTKKYKAIAIAGSHGKSTTTAMTALVLAEGGIDPTVIIGTKLPQWQSNFRKGKSDWLVLEADEWKASFLHYSPALAAVTNIDKEHLDFYKNFSNVKKAFAQFKKQSDKIIAVSKNADHKNEIKSSLNVPGDHNAQNALIAYAVGKELEIPHSVIMRGLKKYRGAWRRMEHRGIFASAEIYDDYGHHPTEIKATLSAFREKWPKKPLICVFQPHQAKRLKALFADFKGAFQAANEVVLLPIYEVTGRDVIADKAYDSQTLAKAIGASYIENPEKDLRRFLSLLTSGKWPKSIIVMMGAGTINQFTEQLV